jgi:hypothetical protein
MKIWKIRRGGERGRVGGKKTHPEKPSWCERRSSLVLQETKRVAKKEQNEPKKRSTQEAKEKRER